MKIQAISARCMRMWYGMRYRCRHSAVYRHTEIMVTKSQFIGWAETEVKNFLYFSPDSTPSVDRIDPTGHYEFGNIRIIDLEENRIRSRFICFYLRLNRISDEREKIAILAKNVVATCRNAGIDRRSLVDYLRNEI